MAIQLRLIDQKDLWEEFLARQKPSTFLHSWAWGAFNEALGTSVIRLGFFEAEEMRAAALILKIEARRGAFYFCPHGPIFAENIDKKTVLSMLIAHLKTLNHFGKPASFIRLSPLLPDFPENHRLFHELGFREAPVHMMHPELGWILDVRPTKEELLKNMRKTTRYSIRKAEKDGVTVEISMNPEDLEKFWTVYQATVDRQNFTPFSKEYLKKEIETFNSSTDQKNGAAFFFASYQNEIIATAIIVFQGNSAFYHHGASVPKFAKITAPYLLQWEVIREAKRRGLEYYNFWGVVPEEKTKHPWAGLSLFKRGFGGSAHAYVHAKDYVLKPTSWLNWGIEKIRKWKRGL